MPFAHNAPREQARLEKVGRDGGSRRDGARVPSGRLTRFGRMARLAGGIAGGVLAEGGRRLVRGDMPPVRDLLLTPANMHRLADQLATLRGAAMKLGQLLSMDSGDLLPPELSMILARLRSDAHAMPRSQLDAVLREAWGRDWGQLFADFSWEPIAAASIGQVHRATALDGRKLALKIQYPGVARSIDSDVNNVAVLLRMTRLLPTGIDMAPLLAEAKRQLRAETDYLREAAHMERFAELLGDAPGLVTPAVDMELTRRKVLVMDFLEGKPLEDMHTAAQHVRDRIVELLFGLLFREIFEFRLVQTDPNFANYLYQVMDRRIVLLDFGATRRYSLRVISGYRKLFRGALARDREQLLSGALAIGYLSRDLDPRYRDALLDLFEMATEPLRAPSRYDFARSDLPARLRDAAMDLGFHSGYRHNPPADAVFLHRKLGGMYLLAARLGARVDVARIIEPHL